MIYELKPKSTFLYFQYLSRTTRLMVTLNTLEHWVKHILAKHVRVGTQSHHMLIMRIFTFFPEKVLQQFQTIVEILGTMGIFGATPWIKPRDGSHAYLKVRSEKPLPHISTGSLSLSLTYSCDHYNNYIHLINNF